MDYRNVLIPQYLKAALIKKEYENGWYFFHRILCGNRQDVNYLKNIIYDDKMNDVVKICYEKSQEYLRDYYEILEQRTGYIYKKMEAKSTSPVVVGLGGQSVTENSMQIHPIYGIPYIAGQQIKGVVRTFYLNEYYEGDEKLAWKNPAFVYLFGKGEEERGKQMYASQEGHLIFYDAYPISDSFKFHKAQMTNHYQKYYQGGNLTDRENPNPISFLTIENLEICFSFGISYMDIKKYIDIENRDSSVVNRSNGASGKKLSSKDEVIDWMSACDEGSIQKIISEVENILTMVMEYYGFGAKTALGYGRFQNVKEKHSGKETSQEKTASGEPEKSIVLEINNPYRVYVIGASDDPNRRYLKLRIEGSEFEGRITAARLKYDKRLKMKDHKYMKNTGNIWYTWYLEKIDGNIAFFREFKN